MIQLCLHLLLSHKDLSFPKHAICLHTFLLFVYAVSFVLTVSIFISHLYKYNLYYKD